MNKKKRKVTKQTKKKKDRSKTKSPFNNMNSDILAHSFSFMTIIEILNLRRVCRNFQDALENPVSIVTLTNTNKKTLSGFVALFSNLVHYRTKNIIRMELEIEHILWVMDFSMSDFGNLRKLKILNTIKSFEKKKISYFHDKNLKDEKMFPSLQYLTVPFVQSEYIHSPEVKRLYIKFLKESYVDLKGYYGILSMEIYEMLKEGSSNTMEKLDISSFIKPINPRDLAFDMFKNLKVFHFQPFIFDKLVSDFNRENDESNLFKDYYELSNTIEDVSIKNMTDNFKVSEFYPNLKSLYLNTGNDDVKLSITNSNIEEIKIKKTIIKSLDFWNNRASKDTNISFDLPNCKSLIFSSICVNYEGNEMLLTGKTNFFFIELKKLEKIYLDINSIHNNIKMEDFQKYQNLKEITLSFSNDVLVNFDEFKHNRVEVASFSNVYFDLIKAPSLKKLVLKVQENKKMKVDCPELETIQVSSWKNLHSREFEVFTPFVLITPKIKTISIKTRSKVKLVGKTPELRNLVNVEPKTIMSFGEKYPENIENVTHIQISEKTKKKELFSFVDLYKSLTNFSSLKTLVINRRNFLGKSIKKSDIVVMDSVKEIYVQMSDKGTFPFHLLPRAFPNLEVFSTNRLLSFSQTDLNQFLKKSPFENMKTMEIKIGNEDLRKIPVSSVLGMILKYTQICVNFSLIYDSHIDNLDITLDMDKRKQLISLKLDNPFTLKGDCENLKYLSCSCSSFDEKTLENVKELEILEIRKCRDFDVMNEEFVQMILDNVDVYLLIMSNSQKKVRGFYHDLFEYKRDNFISWKAMKDYRDEMEKRKTVDYVEFRKLQKKFPKQLLVFEK